MILACPTSILQHAPLVALCQNILGWKLREGNELAIPTLMQSLYIYNSEAGFWLSQTTQGSVDNPHRSHGILWDQPRPVYLDPEVGT